MSVEKISLTYAKYARFDFFYTTLISHLKYGAAWLSLQDKIQSEIANLEI